MAADWRASWPEDHAEFEQALDAKITELKAQVDAQAQESIDNLKNWLEKVHSGEPVTTPSEEETTSATEEDQEATSAAEEDQEPEEEAAAIALLATKQEQEAIDSGFSAGYSTILGLSAAATVAYLYKRRQDEKRSQTESNDSFDEGYQLV